VLDAAVLHAVAAPRRREILRLVWNAEKSAGDIHRELGDVTFGAVSQHLRVLDAAGLLDRRAAGKQRFYRARKASLGPLRASLESMWTDGLARLQLLAEVDEARRGPAPRRRRKKR
jgi:DNA-binding transcriptional ArsR family regulator